MMAGGLVEEVAGLLAQGISSAAKSMQSLGYKQIVSLLSGKMSLEEAVLSIKRDTRRFAKRQLTWFRREKQIYWLDVAENQFPEEIAAKISLIMAGHWK